MSIIRVRDKNGNIIDIPVIKGNDYILTEIDKENIANKTVDLIQEAECIPLGSGVNYLAQYAEGTLTELKPEHLQGVTKIASGAFSGNYTLTSITIDATKTSMESIAFPKCSNLSSVTISGNVEMIDNFVNCTSLTDITLNNGIKEIDGYCFSGCTKLNKIVIPDSVISMGTYVFQNCTNLTDVTIGNGVKRFSDNIFQNCPNITNMTLGNNLSYPGA